MIGLSPQLETKRQTAASIADTLNKIEGVPVTEFAKKTQANGEGEITGTQMKTMLIQKHKKVN